MEAHSTYYETYSLYAVYTDESEHYGIQLAHP